MAGVFEQLSEDIRDIKRMLKDLQGAKEAEELLTIQEAADLLHLSKQTMYRKISAGEYPYIKKAKRVYFLRSDLLQYMKDASVSKDIRAKIDAHLSEKSTR